MSDVRCDWDQGTVWSRPGPAVCGRPAKWLVQGQPGAGQRCVCGLHRRSAERWLGWPTVTTQIEGLVLLEDGVAVFAHVDVGDAGGGDG